MFAKITRVFRPALLPVYTMAPQLPRPTDSFARSAPARFLSALPAIKPPLALPLPTSTKHWAKYFGDINRQKHENFYGNLRVMQHARYENDPYTLQLEAMGVQLMGPAPKTVPFEQMVAWINSQIDTLVQNKTLRECDVLRPGKAFRVNAGPFKGQIVFKRLGEPLEANLVSLNLLTPDEFSQMLAHGYFPMGDATIEHTNQTLAEHDLAHMAAFVSAPLYMKTIRHGFAEVYRIMQSDPQIAEALKSFDSIYSLRLYYTIEIFTQVLPEKRDAIVRAIDIAHTTIPTQQEVTEALLARAAADPGEFSAYLRRIYDLYPSSFNALGGESRDLINRRRKFGRNKTQGSFYPEIDALTSKFDGNSIYSLYQNALAALENKRASHPDFCRSIVEIHAPFISCILGSSQISIPEWVEQAVKPVVEDGSVLREYFEKNFDARHAIYHAFCSREPAKRLKPADMA